MVDTLSHGGDRAATVAFYLPLPCAMVFASPQVLPIFFFKSDLNTLLPGFSLAFHALFTLAQLIMLIYNSRLFYYMFSFLILS